MAALPHFEDEKPTALDTSLASLTIPDTTHKKLLSAHETQFDFRSYDHDYAGLLDANISLRELSDDDGTAQRSVLIMRDADIADQPEGSSPSSRYFLRVPCRRSDARVMQRIGPLAFKHELAIVQMLVDGSHDRFPDFALLVKGTYDSVVEFCVALEELDFVRQFPTVMPVVPV